MDETRVFHLPRCLESLWSILYNAAAPENRKLAFMIRFILQGTSTRAPTCFVSSSGKTTVTAHNLCRLRSTLLMRGLVIDEAYGIFSLGATANSLASADGFVLDLMRCKLELYLTTWNYHLDPRSSEHSLNYA